MFVQKIRALIITGFSAGVVLTLIFVLIPFMSGIWALRISRLSSPLTLQDRLVPGVIGLFGLVFWPGLIIGPVMTFLAVLASEQDKTSSPQMKLTL